MLNKNAKEWVKALRSGKYKQGIGFLNSNGAFCCLGIACELYIKAIPGSLKIKQRYLGEVEYDSLVSLLPAEVVIWLGLNHALGRFCGSSLADLNDARKPFKEIADVIESEPEGLFIK